jgi:hypothetical protein
MPKRIVFLRERGTGLASSFPLNLIGSQYTVPLPILGYANFRESSENLTSKIHPTYVMSFHFGHPVNTKFRHSISPRVTDKGLSLLRAKPCDIQLSIVPQVVQPGYASYIMNLPAFMLATIAQEPVPIINDRGYPTPETRVTIPIALPPLIYSFNKPPTDSKKARILVHSVESSGKGNKSVYTTTMPTLNIIRSLVEDGVDQKTSHIHGTVNIDAMKMVIVIRRVLSAFLITHVYSAFRHELEVPEKEEECTTDSNKRRKIGEVTQTGDDDSTALSLIGDTDELGRDMSNKPRSKNCIKLTHAKPSEEQVHMWGAMDQIPNASGLYVPYVKELAIDDQLTVPELFNDYFLKSLSNNVDGMVIKYSELKSAWGLIEGTDFGRVVTHICKCIDIALRAQATVFLIFTNSIYEGTVISGTGYSIGIRNEIYRPLIFRDLQILVRDSSMHNKSIQRINDMVMPNVTEVRSMRELSNILSGVVLSENEKHEIVEEAYHLAFQQTYWSISPHYIKIMLDLILDADKHIQTNYPMHPKYLFHTGREELVMCAFGHFAPTFLIPNGQVTPLIADDPPKNLLVRSVTVDTAVSDMKYIYGTGAITNNIMNLATKHKDIPIRSVNKLEVWTALKKLYDMMKPAEITMTSVGTKATAIGGDITDDIFG